MEQIESASEKRARLMVRYEMQKMLDWEHAYTEKSIEDIEAQNNVFIINEKLVEWLKGIKAGDKREKTLTTMLRAGNKLLSFLITKESTLRKMTIEMLEYKKLYNEERQKVKDALSEIESLKKQIEFHEETE